MLSILYRFRVIASYLWKVADFNLPHLHLAPSLEIRSNFAEIFSSRKLESRAMVLRCLCDLKFGCL